MRLAVVGLSLLIFGCGGGSDPQNEQPSKEIEKASPAIWQPPTQSPLNNAEMAKSAVISTFKAIDLSISLSKQTFNKLSSGAYDSVPLTSVTSNCGAGGTISVEMSKLGFDYHSGIIFGRCADAAANTELNGSFVGNATIGTTFGSGSGSYTSNGSVSSGKSDKIYLKSRLIKHDVMSVVVNGVTDELIFDVTVAGEAISDGISTAGTVTTKTLSPIKFVDSTNSSPVGGEIAIINGQGSTWLARVVQNGFDIYDTSVSTSVPVDFLNWYSFNK